MPDHDGEHCERTRKSQDTRANVPEKYHDEGVAMSATKTKNSELGLTYVNARYYVSSLNRFASADTIIPDPANPQAYNRFSYVENRSLIMHDPSGHCGADFEMRTVEINGVEVQYAVTDVEKTNKCKKRKARLEEEYEIEITGQWTFWEIMRFSRALSEMSIGLRDLGITDSHAAMRDLLNGSTFHRDRSRKESSDPSRCRSQTQCYRAASHQVKDDGTSLVTLYDDAFYKHDHKGNVIGEYTQDEISTDIVHEIGHIWDVRFGIPSNNSAVYGNDNPYEAFADSFADVILGNATYRGDDEGLRNSYTRALIVGRYGGN